MFNSNYVLSNYFFNTLIYFILLLQISDNQDRSETNEGFTQKHNTLFLDVPTNLLCPKINGLNATVLPVSVNLYSVYLRITEHVLLKIYLLIIDSDNNLKKYRIRGDNLQK